MSLANILNILLAFQMRIMALDFDGTIVDCRKRQTLLAASLCKAVSLQIDNDRFWVEKRRGASTELALRQQGLDKIAAQKLAKLWIEQCENDVWLRIDRVFDEAKTALQCLREVNCEVHLITARARADALHRQLCWLSIRDFFQAVHVVPPQGANIHKAEVLRQIRSDVYVGDTESDFVASRVAGVPFLAVCCGQRSLPFLRKNTSLDIKAIKKNLLTAVKGILDEKP